MRRFLAILFSLVLLAAACGGGSDDDSVTADAAGSDSSDTGSDEGDTSSDAGAGDDSSDSDAGDSGADDAGSDGSSSDDSGDAGSTGSFQELLQAAAQSTVEITSGRMAATMTMEGGVDFPMPVEILLDGEFDFPGEAVALTLDMSGMIEAMTDADDPDAALAATFFEDPIEIISIGETTWLKMGLLAMFLGDSVEWIEMTDDDMTATEQFLPGSTGAFDPQVFINYLQGADGVEELGTEEIRGVETTHYSGVITEEMLAQFSDDADLSEVGSSEEIPFEAWVDGDGLLRRLIMDVTDTGDGTSMTLDWEMYDFGASIDIAPPPADQVTSADALGGLLGAG